MELERFKKLLAAYGGDTARWPDNERAAAEHFASTSDEAQELLSCARELDSLLASAPAPASASAAFMDKLASQPAPRTMRPAQSSISTLGALFQMLRRNSMVPRVAGLVGACAIGIVLGTSQIGRSHNDYLVVDATDNLITNAGLMSDLREID